MRRIVTLTIAVGLVLAVMAVVRVPPVSAAPALRGQIVDSLTGDPVSGAVVRLHPLEFGGAPGPVIDRDRTDADGAFELSAGDSAEEEFFVEVVAGRYQGGWVGGDPLYVQPDVESAGTVGASGDLGPVRAIPAFLRGKVVDSRSKKALGKVKVSVRTSSRPRRVIDADTTNKRGRFVLRGLTCEDDCLVRVNGRKVRHEAGWVACNSGVVATTGAACAVGPGNIGRVFLDRR
ncbi:hypothetical protein [Nocardioides sp.]|uniref:hypothetical protein n=1 Tax=Nocardioides sp. TaxID=35761 RepID=UPI002B269AB5|nr:hypothetical protein [Nocardioides sp.]